MHAWVPTQAGACVPTQAGSCVGTQAGACVGTQAGACVNTVLLTYLLAVYWYFMLDSMSSIQLRRGLILSTSPDLLFLLLLFPLQFRCCGAGSYQDWAESVWLLNKTNSTVAAPDSCCITMSAGCAVRVHPSNIYLDVRTGYLKFNVE